MPAQVFSPIVKRWRGLKMGKSQHQINNTLLQQSALMGRRHSIALCGDRVVQMTKTYNDIDAVTKLLEEKEKDLELAAKIGQSLLNQNKQLEGRIEMIEEQLTVINDQNTQLHHDIKLKDDLLRIYTNDIGQSDSEDESTWSDKNKMVIQSKYINIDTLQKKIKNLEEENLHLRIETAELRTKTTNIEEKEEQLVRDCFKQLGEARGTVEILTDELSKKFEDNMRQQEEITSLLALVVDLQQKVKKLSIENEEMTRHLQASKEAQQNLTQELLEMREKYDEVYRMLQEAQETAKRSNRNPLAHGGIGFGTYLNPLPVFPADSLAAELVDSVEQRLERDPHLSKKGKREYNKNVMNTVKAVNKRSHNSPASGYSSDFYSRQTSPSSSVISLVGSSDRSEMYEGDSESVEDGALPRPHAANIPGSNDLATALRRLKLRRENECAEKDYADLHVDSPICPSPDSFTSGLSGLSGMSTVPAGGGQSFRSYMPEKLQIVKPMEGSMALHHWQRLATPHIASMLDSRPGVVVKGFREIDTKRDTFHLDDIEDDGCVLSSIPSKGFAHTSSTFTYTTSRMGHMGDTMMTSMNPMGTRMTIDLKGDSMPGVYDPPPGASLGLASVLATPQVTSGSAVRLKASDTNVGRRGKRSSIGLNFLSTSPNSEKKAELEVDAPAGIHKVSGQIFSRNTSPMGSISSGIKILDPDTKARLMEKVKAIRAEKAAKNAQQRPLVTTNALMVAPCLAVGIPQSSVSLGGMLMSSSTSSNPRMSVLSSAEQQYGRSSSAPRMSAMSSPAQQYNSTSSTPRMSVMSSPAQQYNSTSATPRMSVMSSPAQQYNSTSSTPRMSVMSSPAQQYSSSNSGPRMSVLSNPAQQYNSASSTPRMSVLNSPAQLYSSSSSSPRMSVLSSPGQQYSTTSSTPRMSVPSIAAMTGGSQQQGSAMSASTPSLPKMQATANPAGTQGHAVTANTPSYGRNILSTGTSSSSMAGSRGSGLLSPNSSPFPPVLGQSRMMASPMASPMSILASSRPITATTTTSETTAAGLVAALDPSGLGQVLDLDTSPKARTVISKTKTRSSAKRL